MLTQGLIRLNQQNLNGKVKTRNHSASATFVSEIYLAIPFEKCISQWSSIMWLHDPDLWPFDLKVLPPVTRIIRNILRTLHFTTFELEAHKGQTNREGRLYWFILRQSFKYLSILVHWWLVKVTCRTMFLLYSWTNRLLSSLVPRFALVANLQRAEMRWCLAIRRSSASSSPSPAALLLLLLPLPLLLLLDNSGVMARQRRRWRRMTESAGREYMVGGEDCCGGGSGRLNESSSPRCRPSCHWRRRSSAAAISRRRVSASASRLTTTSPPDNVFLLLDQLHVSSQTAFTKQHIPQMPRTQAPAI